MGDSKELKKLGDRVRELRRSKNFTQEDLAIACDLNISTIQRIESGKYAAGIDVLFLIAKSLKIETRELF